MPSTPLLLPLYDINHSCGECDAYTTSEDTQLNLCVSYKYNNLTQERLAIGL